MAHFKNHDGVWVSKNLLLNPFNDPKAMPASLKPMAAAAMRGIQEHGWAGYYFSSHGGLNTVIEAMVWCGLITQVGEPDAEAYELTLLGRKVYDAVARRSIPPGWWAMFDGEYEKAYDDAISHTETRS